MVKVLCLGINDREIRPYKMDYLPHMIPQHCELKKRARNQRFRILVEAKHMFYLNRRFMLIFKKPTPCFIFNLLNRQSLKLVKDDNTSVEYLFLGRSVDIHPNESDIDAKTANKLDMLIEPSFWMGVKKSIRLSNMETLIYMGAGIGVWEMVTYVIGQVL